MTKKSNILKKMLATASAAAIITGGASAALGAVRTSTAANVTILDTSAVGLDGAFADTADSVLAHANNVTFTTGGDLTFVAPGIDANAKTGVKFVINHAVNLPGANDFGIGLAAVEVDATGKVITFGQDLGGNLTVANGTVTVGRHLLAGNGAGNFTVSGGIATVTGNAAGAVAVSGGTATVGGNALGAVTVSGGEATVTGNVVGATAISGGKLTAGGNMAAVTFSKSADAKLVKNGGTITGAILATAEGAASTGTLEITTTNVTADLDIATAAAHLAKLKFATDNTLTAKGDVFVDELSATVAANGTLALTKAGALSVYIGATAANGAKAITIGNAGAITNATLEGAIAATNVTLDNGFAHTATLAKNAKITGNFNFGTTAGQKLNFNEGSSVIGNITTGAVNSGLIEVLGSASYKGQNLGNGAGNKINTITLKNADTVFTIESVTGASQVAANGGIIFDATATGKAGLHFKGAQDQNVHAAVNLNAATTTDGLGIITSELDNAKTLAFKAAIGDVANANKALKELNVVVKANETQTIAFEENAHINKLTASKGTTINLNKAAALFKISDLSAAEANLTVSENATLTTAEIGTAEYADFSKLKDVTIANTKTLTLADKSTLSAESLKGTGALTLAGSANINAKGDSANKLDSILATGTGATIKIEKDTYLTNNLDLNNAAGKNTAYINSATFDAADVTASNGAATKNILVLGNSSASGAAQKFQSKVDANYAIKLAGGNVDFTKQMAAASYEFTTTNATTLDFQDATTNLSAVTFTGADAEAAYTIKFKNAATDLAGKLTTGDFLFQGAADYSVTNADSESATYRFSTANKNLTLGTGASGKAMTVKAVGDSTNKPADVIVDQVDVTITGDAISTKYSVAGERTLAFGGNVTGDISLESQNATAKFDKATLVLNDAITTTVAGNGNVLAIAGQTFNKAMGTAVLDLKSASFTGDYKKGAATSTMGLVKTADIYANAITINGVMIGNTAAAAAVNTEGAMTIQNGGLAIASKGHTHTGNLTIADTLALKVAVVDTIPTLTVTGNIAGGTDVDPRVELDASNINGADLRKKPIEGTLVSFNTIDATLAQHIKDLDAKAEVSRVASNNRFVKSDFSVDAATKTMKLKVTDNTLVALKADLANSNVSESDKVAFNSFYDQLINASSDSDAGNFLGTLQTLDSKQSAEAQVRLFKNTTEATANTIRATTGALAGRIDPTIAGPQPVSTAYGDAESGVSAGDYAVRHGAFLSGSFAKAKMKKNKGVAGFTSDGAGATIGVDTKANDQMTVGAALTFSNSKLKHKDTKSGDKTKINSYVLSLYSAHMLSDATALMAFANVGSNESKLDSQRIIAGGKKGLAKAKYTSMSFNGQLMVSHKMPMDGFAVAPMAGLSFTRLNSGGYKETGDTKQNLDVKIKALDSVELMAGAKLMMMPYAAADMLVTPEVHAFISQQLTSNRPTSSVTLNGFKEPVTSKGPKTAKTSYNVGFSLNSSNGDMDFGFGYDANIAKKYMGHVGTAKVRLNF